MCCTVVVVNTSQPIKIVIVSTEYVQLKKDVFTFNVYFLYLLVFMEQTISS